jgi:hypothetical protein
LLQKRAALQTIHINKSGCELPAAHEPAFSAIKAWQKPDDIFHARPILLTRRPFCSFTAVFHETIQVPQHSPVAFFARAKLSGA